ncbi:MAG: dihydrolipoamide acetyltransferase family protein, partial [bacterium]
MAEVIMPKMGDAMTEGKVLRWLKRPGDRVEPGEALAEIETDKVNVEMPAEEAGVLTQIVVSAGGVAPVGGTIAMIGRPGDAPATASAAPAAAPPSPAPTQAAPGAPTPTPSRAPSDDRIKASPLARRIAAEQGIDLSHIEGTGPEGRITREDLEAFLAHRPAAAPPAAAPAPPTAPARPAAAPTTPGADVTLTRMRQTIARRMSESKQQVPHFYVTVEILMDEAAKMREQVNKDLGGKIVSLNDLILKAAAVALRAFPNLNATFMGETVRRHDEIHMGFAVALPEGLIVPVIRD